MQWQKLIKYFYSLVKTEGPHVWGQCFHSCFTFVLCHWSLTWHCIQPGNKRLVSEAAAAPKMVSPALSSYVFCLWQTSDCLNLNFKDSVISALHSPLVWKRSPILVPFERSMYFSMMGMDQQASVMLVLPLLLIRPGLITPGLPSTGSARPSCPQHAGCCCPSHPAGYKTELTKYLPAGFFCFLLSGLLEKKPIITHVWAFSSSICLFLPAVLHKGAHA